MSGANLEVERLSFSSISRPKHRSSSKSWFGAETEGERSEPEGRVFRLIYRKEYTVLFSIKRSTFSRAATYEGSQGERCGAGLHRGAKKSAAAGVYTGEPRGALRRGFTQGSQGERCGGESER